jgi:hypothetical protein
MAQRAQAVLDEVREWAVTEPFDAAFMQRAGARMQALQPLMSEDDRLHWMQAYCRLARWFEQLAPEDARAPCTALRQQVDTVFDAMYGHARTPYLIANQIVQRLVGQLSDEADLGEALVEAMHAIEALADADAAIAASALLRVQSVVTAHQWLRAPERDDPLDRRLTAIVRQMRADNLAGSLSIPQVLAHAGTLEPREGASSEEQRAVAEALQVVYGVMLLSVPEMAPGLEPLRDWIQALLAETASKQAPSHPPIPPTPLSTAERLRTILAAQQEALQRGEFSELLLRKTMAEIKAVPTDGAADARAVHQALVDMVDQALPHATPDAGPALEVVRQQLIDMRDAPAQPEPLSVAEAIAAITDVVQVLRRELAAGVDTSAAVLRATGRLQHVAGRLGAQDADADPALLRTMTEAMRDIAAAVRPHVPEADRATYGEVASAMDGLFAQAPAIAAEQDPTALALHAEAVAPALERVGQAGDWQALAGQLADSPHVLQFLQLLPGLLERATQPRLRMQPESGDAQALAGLAARMDDALSLMRAATTEAQFMAPQRSMLRRAALELRQFERRRHAMLARPAWPAVPVALDANAVFHAGDAQSAALVDAACARLGLHRPDTPPADHPVQARWQSLRRAGVAVFDFSPYDPTQADSGVRLPDSPEAERAVLRAAAAVATVAYECGWALALGTPVVILARAGQPLPFDIDIAPMPLSGNVQADAQRLAAALQAAIYTAQRQAVGDALAATLAHAGEVLDAGVQPLLAMAEHGADAAPAVQALSAAVARASRPGWALLRPALPPGYPDPEAPSLFHITAFRDWSLPVQTALRTVCAQRGCTYRIGYERLTPDVLGVIWADLCRADHVVCDITQLNPNALFELGIVHAVGRPVLIVTHDAEPHLHFGVIRHLRTHRIDPAADADGLHQLVHDFANGLGAMA